MITNLKKWGFLSLIGVGIGLLLFMVPKAIKFFFRGILIGSKREIFLIVGSTPTYFTINFKT
jgi:hypothetical protein